MDSAQAPAMKLLGVIPARGGSKRLPGKNVRALAGRPLIDWTVRAARASGVLQDLVVSTDDPSIAAVAASCGVPVPRLRPADLATDEASSVAVLAHELRAWESEHGQRLDGAVLLQPTSPFRTAATIARAVERFAVAGGQQTVVGVSAAAAHPWWCLSVDTDGVASEWHPGGLRTRGQDLPPVHQINGTVYVAPRALLVADPPALYTQRLLAVVVDAGEALDIDTEDDWAVAEALAARRLAMPHPAAGQPESGG